MRKYFTRRCILLHLLVIVLVPAFLVAGWWQYEVARGGNTLSWVYTVEWPFFALYALYVWWRMIHDQSTLFDRMWAARQRAAADASGMPLHEIPGWAMDKALSKEVVQASLAAARAPALEQGRRGALAPGSEPATGGVAGTAGTALGWQAPAQVPQLSSTVESSGPNAALQRHDPDEGLHHEGVIDARVLDVRTNVDEELDAYNRYLADLALRDPPKRWGSGGRRTEVKDGGER